MDRECQKCKSWPVRYRTKVYSCGGCGKKANLCSDCGNVWTTCSPACAEAWRKEARTGLPKVKLTPPADAIASEPKGVAKFQRPLFG